MTNNEIVRNEERNEKEKVEILNTLLTIAREELTILEE